MRSLTPPIRKVNPKSIASQIAKDPILRRESRTREYMVINISNAMGSCLLVGALIGRFPSPRID